MPSKRSLSKTNIGWTAFVWNPTTGCDEIGAGCKFCYAKTLHNQRHGAYKQGKLPNLPQYSKPFNEIQLHEDRLLSPLHLKKPSKIFVDSMGDLFHKDVPFNFIYNVFDTIEQCPQHTFQVLTKRPQRALKLMVDYHLWDIFSLKNLWLGVSVSTQKEYDELFPLLIQTPAAVHFVSFEPLLEEIKILDVSGWKEPHKYWGENLKLDWVICGGETGKNARPMHPDWARSLRDQCKAANIPFFFKQWGKWTPTTEWAKRNSIEPEQVRYMMPTGEIYQTGTGQCNTMEGTLIHDAGRRSGDLLDGVEYNQFPEVK